MWFRLLFGFEESSYEETRRQLFVRAGRLHSRVNDASYAVGEFSTPTLAELRETGRAVARRGRLNATHEAIGDILELHAQPENAGALFQVASQFNCLEFPDPSTVPEGGVTNRPSPTSKDEVRAIFDGQIGFVMNQGDSILISASPHRTRLIRFPDRTYYDVLRNKLKWGNG